MDGHIPSQLNYLTLNDIENETFEEKKENISTIMSAKNFLPGHKKRLLFTSKLLEDKEIGLHVFGHGFNNIADKREALALINIILQLKMGSSSLLDRKTC